MKKKVDRIMRLMLSTILVFLFAVAALMPAVAAASDEIPFAGKSPIDDGRDHRKPGPYKAGFASVWAGNTWGVQAIHEVEYALSSNPDISEWWVTDADFNASKQVADIEDLLAKGIDLLVLQPVNAEALTPVIEEAYNRGVVVVTTASKLETDKYTAALVSDETEFGRAGGTWLVEKLGGKGNVIILDGMSGIATADQRRAGAMSVFDKYPDIKVVAKEFADWDYAKGKMATENMLAANPVIDGVWSSGGDMTRGAIEAFVENGRPLIPMTGEDGNGFLKLWKKYIDDPGFDSIATTMPAWIYGEGVNTGVRILKGEPYEKEVVNPVPTILRDTLDEYVRDDLNDSFWANTRLPEELIQKFYGQ